MLRTIPDSLTSGLSYRIRLELDDYPAPEFAATLLLRGPSVLSQASTDDLTGHLLNLTTAITSGLEAGSYSYAVRVTDGLGDVFEVETGRLDVLADLAAAPAGHDPRKHCEKVLETIEAVLENRATFAQQSYSIGGRSLSRIPPADLLQLRDRYRREVARLRGRSRLLGRQLKVRMP